MSLNCSSVDSNKDVENIQSKYMLVFVMVIMKIMTMLMVVILMMVIVVR